MKGARQVEEMACCPLCEMEGTRVNIGPMAFLVEREFFVVTRCQLLCPKGHEVIWTVSPDPALAMKEMGICGKHIAEALHLVPLFFGN